MTVFTSDYSSGLYGDYVVSRLRLDRRGGPGIRERRRGRRQPRRADPHRRRGRARARLARVGRVFRRCSASARRSGGRSATPIRRRRAADVAVVSHDFWARAFACAAVGARHHRDAERQRRSRSSAWRSRASAGWISGARSTSGSRWCLRRPRPMRAATAAFRRRSARLKPGSSRADAQAQLTALAGAAGAGVSGHEPRHARSSARSPADGRDAGDAHPAGLPRAGDVARGAS